MIQATFYDVYDVDRSLFTTWARITLISLI